MKKISFRLVFLLILSFVFLSTADAQSKSSKKSVKPVPVFDVRLPISVFDKKKQFVSGLNAKDFVVLENGRRQKVLAFSNEKNSSPAYIGLLMGTSTSTRTKLVFLKAAMRDLAYSIVRLKKDKAAFLTFDHEIILRQDFTDKIDLLDTAIDRVKENGQKTSIYDAVYQFCDEKLRTANGRRVIVVISDSKDDFSRTKLSEAIDIAQRTETNVFVISTNDVSLRTNKDAAVNDAKVKDLMTLTTETGGRSFFVSNTMELNKVLSSILKEIHSQYVITYRPKNQKYDGKDRSLKVRFARRNNNKNYEIRTKTKYRAVKSLK